MTNPSSPEPRLIIIDEIIGDTKLGPSGKPHHTWIAVRSAHLPVGNFNQSYILAPKGTKLTTFVFVVPGLRGNYPCQVDWVANLEDSTDASETETCKF